MTRALLAMCALAACKQASEPPPGRSIVHESRELADKMCACKAGDKACGVPLRVAWDALTREISGVEFTAEQVEMMAATDQRFFACMAKLDP